jgi:hypothetical protein
VKTFVTAGMVHATALWALVQYGWPPRTDLTIGPAMLPWLSLYPTTWFALCATLVVFSVIAGAVSYVDDTVNADCDCPHTGDCEYR